MENPEQENKTSLQNLAVLYNLIQDLDTTQLKLRKTFAHGCSEIYRGGASSLGEISKVVGISRQRLSQIINSDE